MSNWNFIARGAPRSLRSPNGVAARLIFPAARRRRGRHRGSGGSCHLGDRRSNRGKFVMVGIWFTQRYAAAAAEFSIDEPRVESPRDEVVVFQHPLEERDRRLDAAYLVL